MAKESTQNNAKDDDDDIGSSPVVDDVPSDFTIRSTEKIPLYFISQISGKIIKKEKMIITSTGVYYDKDELIRLISSSKNPVCVVTGKYSEGKDAI